MTMNELFLLLEKKNINIRPDDTDAFKMILRQLDDEDGAQLARARELARSVVSETSKRCDDAKRFISDIDASIPRARASVVGMLDECRKHGILREYSFGFSADEVNFVRLCFARLCGELSRETSILSAAVGRTGIEAERMSELSRQARALALEFKYAAVADALLGRTRDGSEIENTSVGADIVEAGRRAEKAGEALTAAMGRASAAAEELSATLSASEAALGFIEVSESAEREAMPGRFFALMSKCAGVLGNISAAKSG